MSTELVTTETKAALDAFPLPSVAKNRRRTYDDMSSDISEKGVKLFNTLLFESTSDELATALESLDLTNNSVFAKRRECASKNRYLVYRFHEKRIEVPAKSLSMVAITSMGAVNEFGVSLLSPYKLYGFQRDTVQFAIDCETRVITHPYYRADRCGCLLAVIMGLGKSLISGVVTSRTIVDQRSEMSCTLYVCPKNLLGTIKYEFEKFFGNSLRVLVYHRDVMKDAEFDTFDASQIKKYDVIITNYASIVQRAILSGKVEGGRKKDAKMGEEAEDADSAKKIATSFMDFNWYRIVLDESHEARERKSQRSESLRSLKSTRVICMTGTPIHNTLRDLAVQLELTGLKFDPKKKYTTQVLQSSNLLKMVKHVTLDDAREVELPIKTVHRILFDLSPEERMIHDHYVSSARNNRNDMKTAIGKGKMRKVGEVRFNMVKAMQACGAPYLLTPDAKTKKTDTSTLSSDALATFPPHVQEWMKNKNGSAGFQSTKMSTFYQLIDRLHTQGSKVVVFANFSSTLKLAREAILSHRPGTEEEIVFIHGGITSTTARDKCYTKFRTDPKAATMFITLKLGGAGLNLADADCVIFLETWYAYSALLQGESRVHRIGQTKPVNIYYLTGKGTVEEHVHNIAEKKREIAQSISGKTETNVDPEDLYSILDKLAPVPPVATA